MLVSPDAAPSGRAALAARAMRRGVGGAGVSAAWGIGLCARRRARLASTCGWSRWSRYQKRFQSCHETDTSLSTPVSTSPARRARLTATPAAALPASRAPSAARATSRAPPRRKIAAHPHTGRAMPAPRPAPPPALAPCPPRSRPRPRPRSLRTRMRACPQAPRPRLRRCAAPALELASV